MHYSAPLPQPGSLLAGYRIESVLSRGPVATVYRVTSTVLGQEYALKAIRPEFAGDPDFRRRFDRAVRTAATVRHPGIVAVHYGGEHDGAVFVVMDLVQGSDLAKLVREDGPIAPRRAARFLTHVAAAIDAGHRRGLVHGNIKPSTVLIGHEGSVEQAYLTAFGFDGDLAAVDATGPGLLPSAVNYVSPEQIRGQNLGPRSDIYALACVFFEALTGTVPFERNSGLATMWAHVHDPRPSLAAARAELGSALDAVMAQAMDPDPDRRQAS